jgi:hypothetical protein
MFYLLNWPNHLAAAVPNRGNAAADRFLTFDDRQAVLAKKFGLDVKQYPMLKDLKPAYLKR